MFCDTAPVPERYWAWRAGLRWIGKNTQLIIPHAGSTFFLGELFLNTEADTYDRPQPNRCGRCNRCLQACPTKALETPYSLNAHRCLSYLTIENKSEIPTLSPPLWETVCMGVTNVRKLVPGTGLPLPAGHRNCNPHRSS